VSLQTLQPPTTEGGGGPQTLQSQAIPHAITTESNSTPLQSQAIPHAITSGSNSTQPVNDAVTMKKHQRQRNFGGIEPCPLLIKLARSLDLEHEISTTHIFHHKE